MRGTDRRTMASVPHRRDAAERPIAGTPLPMATDLLTPQSPDSSRAARLARSSVRCRRHLTRRLPLEADIGLPVNERRLRPTLGLPTWQLALLKPSVRPHERAAGIGKRRKAPEWPGLGPTGPPIPPSSPTDLSVLDIHTEVANGRKTDIDRP